MLKHHKILVVEDDPSLQNLIYRGLRFNTLRILQAHTVREAEKLFAENEDIDLVLLDGCLTGDNPDGLDLIPMFLERENLTIVAMSSNPNLREIMLERGCHDEVESKQFAAAKAREVLNIKPG